MKYILNFPYGKHSRINEFPAVYGRVSFTLKTISRYLFSALLALGSVFYTSLCVAEDIDLFVGSAAGNAQVLIIFDNSGSMATIVEADKPPFDSLITYNTQGSISSSRVYWSSGSTPPSSSTSQWFYVSSNNCADSQASLGGQGLYNGSVRGWNPSWWSSRSSWDRLSSRDHPDYVDCQADVLNNDSSNVSRANGFPRNGSSGPFTSSVSNSNTSWSSSNRTLYSANYMNWYHDDNLAPEDRTRLEIAKDVIKDMVLSTTSIDFGLMVFNQGDGSKNGGRLVKKIESMDYNDRVAFNLVVDSLLAENWTPLSETLYESYLYLTGQTVLYGDVDSGGTPGRDTSAELNNKYIIPDEDCGDYVNVILITDGEPTKDEDANSRIESLTGETCAIFNGEKNCLPTLAKYMAADINASNTLDSKSVKVYTVGFQTNQELLETTADEEHGQGSYYYANDTLELAFAFRRVVNEILETPTRFTSPSIATNVFNRTRSLDEAYLASFSPSVYPRWEGNLKKLQIGEKGVLTDKLGALAIDDVSGEIKEDATTFWGNVQDGGEVNKGGAGRVMVEESPLPADRKVFVNTGEGGSLEVFDKDNEALNAELFELGEAGQLDALIDWSIGIDVQDEDRDLDTDEPRPWIMGDPLHSTPISINYGAINGRSEENPDVRILFGTNAGFLHMINSSNGKESWAFMPKKLAKIQPVLYENASVSDHPYGVDGNIGLFMLDEDKDGNVSSGDKVYAYFGLRRGGSAVYGMDITDPDNPKMLWSIDETTSGFSELGQTWSTPIITRVPGHDGWAVIFGAGYDENKDLLDSNGQPAVGTEDSLGRGIYIVDFETGELIWSITPAVNSGTNRALGALTDSVVAPVSRLDSNGDGITDRLYFVDTGANIWRVDMPGNKLPSAGGQWSVFKFAELGGTSVRHDRRFYHRMSILQTKFQNNNYDALVVGSGNRAHPGATLTIDYMFMLKDLEINSSCHGFSAACSSTVPAPVALNDLYNITKNFIQDGVSEQKRQKSLEGLISEKGWRLKLTDKGEKILGTASTVKGTLVFSSFVPGQSKDECSAGIGSQYAYAINLHTGVAVYWGPDDNKSKDDRRRNVKGSGLFGDPGLYYGDESITQLIGLDPDGVIDHDFKLKAHGTYWYED
ncbi:MAG: hypothetical protein COB04_02900 [Gammaproteobacteria bacterium]|nr:MAG: hypothetical protein COB04_02900 [Gammaproteobacteria bacterium]